MRRRPGGSPHRPGAWQGDPRRGCDGSYDPPYDADCLRFTPVPSHVFCLQQEPIQRLKGQLLAEGSGLMLQYPKLSPLVGTAWCRDAPPVEFTMTITENHIPNIPRDEQGRYRSKPLPSMRGTNVQLQPRIDKPEQRAEWQRRVDAPETFITLDLFCGGGGMSLGFEEAKFFVAAGIDQEPMAIATHDYNFLSKGIACDIRAIPDPQELLDRLGLPRIDVIIGGPPCQGFARIGKGKLRSIELEQQYEELLNTLYREFMRFVEALNPIAFVMENVPDMARYQSGEILKRMKSHFVDYTIDWRILNAVDYGVPQRRQRLFVQGNRLGQKVRWPRLQVANRLTTVRDAISDLPDRTPPSLEEVLPYHPQEPLTDYQKKMREGVLPEHQNKVFGHIIRQVRDDDRLIFSRLEEGQKYRDLPPELQRYRTDIFDDKYWRLIYDQPSWTVTAHIRKDAYRYIHPQYCRTLSIREFARLQSFPDRFLFAGPRTERLRQIGNAVPPMLARAIAVELHRQLATHRTKQQTREERLRRRMTYQARQHPSDKVAAD